MSYELHNIRLSNSGPHSASAAEKNEAESDLVGGHKKAEASIIRCDASAVVHPAIRLHRARINSTLFSHSIKMVRTLLKSLKSYSILSLFMCTASMGVGYSP
jgi:hypothetical protein